MATPCPQRPLQHQHSGVGSVPLHHDAECLGPIRSKSLAVSGVKTMTERVVDNQGIHNPAMSRIGRCHYNRHTSRIGEQGSMRVKVTGDRLPGRQCGTNHNVHVGIQCGREILDIYPADEAAVTWNVDVEVRLDRQGLPDVRGACIHGRRGARFLYLSWGTMDAAGLFTMFRKAKLLFADIEPYMLDAAGQSACHLQAHLELTDRHGGPRCGAIRPPNIQWIARA